MIALGLGDVLLAYAGGLVVLLLLAWLAGGFFRRRRERRRRRNCIHCMFCGTLYDSPSNESLPPCPQCARPNERTPSSAI